MLNWPPGRPCCRGVELRSEGLGRIFWTSLNLQIFEWEHRVAGHIKFFLYDCQKYEERFGFALQILNVCMPGASVLAADLETVYKKCWIRLVMWRWLTDNGSQNNCVKTAKNTKRIWWVLRFLWWLPFVIVLEASGCIFNNFSCIFDQLDYSVTTNMPVERSASLKSIDYLLLSIYSYLCHCKISIFKKTNFLLHERS